MAGHRNLDLDPVARGLPPRMQRTQKASRSASLFKVTKTTTENESLTYKTLEEMLEKGRSLG